MAILMLMHWKGVTVEQYEQTRAIVNWEGNRPAGALHHVAAADAEGLRVVDLWESAEQFEAFVNDRLMPGTVQAGMVGEPEVQLLPVHAVYTPAQR